MKRRFEHKTMNVFNGNYTYYVNECIHYFTGSGKSGTIERPGDQLNALCINDEELFFVVDRCVLYRGKLEEGVFRPDESVPKGENLILRDRHGKILLCSRDMDTLHVKVFFNDNDEWVDISPMSENIVQEFPEIESSIALVCKHSGKVYYGCYNSSIKKIFWKHVNIDTGFNDLTIDDDFIWFTKATEHDGVRMRTLYKLDIHNVDANPVKITTGYIVGGIHSYEGVVAMIFLGEMVLLRKDGSFAVVKTPGAERVHDEFPVCLIGHKNHLMVRTFKDHIFLVTFNENAVSFKQIC